MPPKTSEAKIKKFFEMSIQLARTAAATPIAMMIAKKGTGADVVALSGMSNNLTYLSADKMSVEAEVVAELAKAIQNGRAVFLEIGEYMHPTIYNALYLLSNANRIEYNTPKERVVALAQKGAVVIMFANESNLNKLNYDNLLNFISITERI